MSPARAPSVLVTGAVGLGGTRLDLAVVDGRIADGSGDGEIRIDGAGLTAVPGYIDLQVNGAAGIDLTSEPGRVWEVAAALPRFGVTSFLPTLVSAPAPVVAEALAALASGPPGGWVGARPIGLHLEGPLIASRFAGAHRRDRIVPASVQATEGWTRDAGVAMVTLAPELPGADEVIRSLAGRGVVVSAGHTGADAAGAHRAAASGVTAVTHLFNAMAPLHHRDPGLAGAVLDGLPLTAGLIADGVHLAPEALRLAWRALAPERRLLVSDATAALGAPPGRYRLGDLGIESDGLVVRGEDGGLAGSATGLDSCVRNVVAVTGCEPADAVRAATATPAALLDRHDLGALRPGCAGDLVLLDGDLRVVVAIAAGAVAHRRADG